MHCLKYGKIIITLLVVTTSLGIDSTSLIEIDFGQKIIPPTLKFQGTFAETHEHETIGKADATYDFKYPSSKHRFEETSAKSCIQKLIDTNMKNINLQIFGTNEFFCKILSRAQKVIER